MKVSFLNAINLSGMLDLDSKKSQNKRFGFDTPVDVVSFSAAKGARDAGQVSLDKDIKEILLPRKESPVIFIHGLGVYGDSLKKFSGFAQEAGYQVKIEDYENINNTGSTDASAHLISKDINESRRDATIKQLSEISQIISNEEDLQKFFKVDPSLQREKKAKLTSIIKEIVNDAHEVLNNYNDQSFSSNMKSVEQSLKEKIKNSDIINCKNESDDYDLLCTKAASDIMETISPKALIVAHSMGAFVANTVILNPDSYDGGNGIASALLISGAVNGKRMSATESLVAREYDATEKNGGTNKLTRNEAINAAGQIYQYLENYLKKQYEALENAHNKSKFFKEKIAGKKPPNNLTVISAYDTKDVVVEASDSKLDLSQNNLHNIEFNRPSTEKEKNNPNAHLNVLIHLKTAASPDLVGQQFVRNILTNSQYAVRAIDKANNESFRYTTLKLLAKQEEKQPGFLMKQNGVVKKLREVAAEGLPFTDSPSYLAGQILEKI